MPSSARGPRWDFPLGGVLTTSELAADPHPALRRLRESEPVSWLPTLGGWLVTSADIAETVLRDGRTFTVDDPRFTTARVVGPSMLSLDGDEHRRHRDPFARALRDATTRGRLEAATASHASRLVDAVAAQDGTAELRRGLAGQLAVAVMAEMLGLDVAPAQLLSWYDAIVAGVSSLAEAGAPELPAVPADAASAFAELRACVQATLGDPAGPAARDSVLTAAAADGLTVDEIVSNAAVMLFGGIETTEGMICNALWYLLGDPAARACVQDDRMLTATAVEEALRLEPAAAVVDRFATADVRLGAADVLSGDLVTVSLAGANRDPAVFADPDRFDLDRPNSRQHLAFAVGPHFCVGAQLARLEANAALTALLDRLPDLRLDPARPSAPYGLVFRKPPSLYVCWDT